MVVRWMLQEVDRGRLSSWPVSILQWCIQHRDTIQSSSLVSPHLPVHVNCQRNQTVTEKHNAGWAIQIHGNVRKQNVSRLKSRTHLCYPNTVTTCSILSSYLLWSMRLLKLWTDKRRMKILLLHFVVFRNWPRIQEYHTKEQSFTSRETSRCTSTQRRKLLT